MRPCPGCQEAQPRDAEGRCSSCGGLWLAGAADARGRRLIGKGPQTPFVCADCGGGLKALDVPGAIHEGDLFWGHESPRPPGTCVADGCPRCGGIFVDASNLQASGGTRSFRDSLNEVLRHAS